LLEKVRGARFGEERKEAEQKIVEKSCECARKVTNLCGYIAKMYAFAETAWKAKNYSLAGDALAKVRELERELEKAYAEDKEWSEAFWAVMREEI